jgi:DNA-binding GntR family transcriptional regulator
MELGAVARAETLTERVYGQLKQALIAGVFSPGEKITIRQLAARLDVSPTPVRDALNALVSEGALELGRNRSVYVPVLLPGRLRELIEIRIALEGLAAEKAAPGMTPDRLAVLEDHNRVLVAATRAGDFKTVMERNQLFHFSIYEASGMPSLLRMIESLWLQTGGYLNLIYPAFAAGSQGLDNHEQILQALRSREPAAVREALTRDIRYAAERITKTLEDRDS